MFIPVLITQQFSVWQAIIRLSKNIRECRLHSYVEIKSAKMPN